MFEEIEPKKLILFPLLPQGTPVEFCFFLSLNTNVLGNRKFAIFRLFASPSEEVTVAKSYVSKQLENKSKCRIKSLRNLTKDYFQSFKTLLLNYT